MSFPSSQMCRIPARMRMSPSRGDSFDICLAMRKSRARPVIFPNALYVFCAMLVDVFLRAGLAFAEIAVSHHLVTIEFFMRLVDAALEASLHFSILYQNGGSSSKISSAVTGSATAAGIAWP